MAKFFSYGKDGGPDSVVSGYWLVELKSLFSIVLLRFGDGSRDEYHNHAFNSISWLVKGRLREESINPEVWVKPVSYHRWAKYKYYAPSIKPIITPRTKFHRVYSVGTSWVISFRGPWVSKWKEFWPKTNKFVTLSNGRKIEDA